MILPRRLKLALRPFGVLKAKKGPSRATFQLWSKFRRHSNTPESNSSTRMSWAASAFGWQRRKESDNVNPLVSTKIPEAGAAKPNVRKILDITPGNHRSQCRLRTHP